MRGQQSREAVLEKIFQSLQPWKAAVKEPPDYRISNTKLFTKKFEFNKVLYKCLRCNLKSKCASDRLKEGYFLNKCAEDKAQFANIP